MKQTIAVLALTGAALLLSGCGVLRGTGCSENPAYAQAESRPALEVPAGLEAPDTAQALRIPALNEPEQPVPPGTCLDSPPRYTVPRARPDA